MKGVPLTRRTRPSGSAGGAVVLADEGAVERAGGVELFAGFAQLAAQVDLAGQEPVDLCLQIVDRGGAGAVFGVDVADLVADRPCEALLEAPDLVVCGAGACCLAVSISTRNEAALSAVWPFRPATKRAWISVVARVIWAAKWLATNER